MHISSNNVRICFFHGVNNDTENKGRTIQTVRLSVAPGEERQ